MVFNDISARDLQLANNQWTGGKAIDTFAPCGPVVVTLEEIENIQALPVRTRVNGNTVQDGNTADMIFGSAFAQKKPPVRPPARWPLQVQTGCVALSSTLASGPSGDDPPHLPVGGAVQRVADDRRQEDPASAVHPPAEESGAATTRRVGRLILLAPDRGWCAQGACGQINPLRSDSQWLTGRWMSI
jgi:hypothetical protein